MEVINDRLEVVDFFYKNQTLCQEIRSIMSPNQDAQKALQRLALGYIVSSRVLRDILDTMKIVKKLHNLLLNHSTMAKTLKSFETCDDLISFLDITLADLNNTNEERLFRK